MENKKPTLFIFFLVISIFLILGGSYYFYKIKKQPIPKEEPLKLPQPKEKTLTTVNLEPYSLIPKEKIEKTTWEWDKEKNGGQFNNISLNTKIYMPFDGYVEYGYNMYLKVNEMRIYSQDRSIFIQIVGYFNFNQNLVGSLVKKGTVIATFDKNPPKNNLFKQEKPFLVIYAYRMENNTPFPDPQLIKQLFPEIQ